MDTYSFPGITITVIKNPFKLLRVIFPKVRAAFGCDTIVEKAFIVWVAATAVISGGETVIVRTDEGM